MHPCLLPSQLKGSSCRAVNIYLSHLVLSLPNIKCKQAFFTLITPLQPVTVSLNTATPWCHHKASFIWAYQCVPCARAMFTHAWMHRCSVHGHSRCSQSDICVSARPKHRLGAATVSMQLLHLLTTFGPAAAVLAPLGEPP